MAGREVAIGLRSQLLDGEPLVARLLTRVAGGFLLGAVAGLFWGLWVIPRGARPITRTG